jgi:hypothetical protein
MPWLPLAREGRVRRVNRTKASCLICSAGDEKSYARARRLKAPLDECLLKRSEAREAFHDNVKRRQERRSEPRSRCSLERLTNSGSSLACCIVQGRQQESHLRIDVAVWSEVFAWPPPTFVEVNQCVKPCTSIAPQSSAKARISARRSVESPQQQRSVLKS